ncbi:MAG: hypothetical protein D6808_07120 [Candidatus Dadabacteria bacterium]|nr:MAG: hypothetical protein D6808_07120 [Candidatus Dadabacteria bacterium]
MVYLALFAVINLLVINGGFFFHGSLRPLGSYYFRSKLFREIQRVLPPKLPVPLPKDYVEGLDYVRFREQTALGFGNMYLLGEIHENKGFPGYFFYALLFKLPLPVIVLFLWALWEYLFGRRRKAFLRDEIFLLIPIAFWLIYFNYFNNSHIGIRYVLPTIPLIHIFCGSIFAKDFISKRRVWAGALLGVWLIASVLSYFPHYIPYFNEIVWDRKFAYRYLSDSNIDWGQGRYYARDYLKAHPDIIFEPPIHTKGKILVGVNALTGVWIFGAKSKREMADRYRWLREGHSPIGHVAYSYLLFDVP